MVSWSDPTTERVLWVLGVVFGWLGGFFSFEFLKVLQGSQLPIRSEGHWSLGIGSQGNPERCTWDSQWLLGLVRA